MIPWQIIYAYPKSQMHNWRINEAAWEPELPWNIDWAYVNVNVYKRLQVVVSTREMEKVYCCGFTNLSTLAGVFENIRLQMLFSTNELAKKAEITILSARESTQPGLQAGASWVESKPYIRESVARDSHLGLRINPVQSSV